MNKAGGEEEEEEEAVPSRPPPPPQLWMLRGRQKEGGEKRNLPFLRILSAVRAETVEVGMTMAVIGKDVFRNAPQGTIFG